jgi:hypothetical protein
MASDLCERNDNGDPASRDPDEISSFFLASGLVIEVFAGVLRDFLPSARDEPPVDLDLETARRKPWVAPERPPEESVEATAARCAILLRRELAG